MTDQNISCEYCGAPLSSGANFCDACGQPVKKPQAVQPPPAQIPSDQTILSSKPEPLADQTILSSKPEPPAPLPVSPPPPAYTPAPAYVPPPSPPKRSSTLPIILGVGGCLVILCIALIAILALVLLRNRPKVSDLSKVVPLEPTLILMLTDTPIPTQVVLATRAPLPTDPLAPTMVPTATQVPLATDAPAPTQPDFQVLVWPANIGQQLTGTYFSDDFSTTQYDWASAQDEIQFWGFEDEHYALHLYQAGYTAWAYLPLEFTPTTIGFDAAILPGYDQGAYGVICYYTDEENYHFISMDPYNREYSIGYILNGDYETLMEDMWMPSQTLKDSPYEINNVLAVCDPDMITLFVNNELEAQATVSSVTGGVSAIYGETWEETPPDGFRVLFDNLYAFKPAQ
jgi:hypothetical protein